MGASFDAALSWLAAEACRAAAHYPGLSTSIQQSLWPSGVQRIFRLLTAGALLLRQSAPFGSAKATRAEGRWSEKQGGQL